MLFDRGAHEALTSHRWSPARARAAIAGIVADAEAAFDPATLWPAHPLDLEGGPLDAPASAYLGAAGVIWALDDLQRHGHATLAREWASVAAGLPERYRAAPDFPEDTGGEPVPSLWMARPGSCSSPTGSRPRRGRPSACSPAWRPTRTTRRRS